MRRLGLVLFLLASLLSPQASFGDGASNFPMICPVAPLFPIIEGIVYYCDHYQTTCEEVPRAYYLIGELEWPANCGGECYFAGEWTGEGFGNNAIRKGGRFQGLEAPIAPTEMLKLASGPARDNSRIFVDPAIPFVEFADVERKTHFAKVFACGIDLKGAASNRGQFMNRVIYVALECTKPEDSHYVPVSCTALDPEPVAGPWKCYAYRAVFQPSPTMQAQEILILAAKKKEVPTLATK